MKTALPVFRLLAVVALSAVLSRAFALEPPVPNADVIEAKLKEVEASAELDEAAKTTLTELYRKSISNLETAQANRQAADAFEQARNSAPEEARITREKLEQAKQESPTVTVSVTEETPLEEVEQQLLNEKANQAAVDAKLSELEKRLSDETDRPKTARQELTEAKQNQEKIGEELKKPADAGELPLLTEARRWQRKTGMRALSMVIRRLDQELLSQSIGEIDALF